MTLSLYAIVHSSAGEAAEKQLSVVSFQ